MEKNPHCTVWYQCVPHTETWDKRKKLSEVIKNKITAKKGQSKIISKQLDISVTTAAIIIKKIKVCGL